MGLQTLHLTTFKYIYTRYLVCIIIIPLPFHILHTKHFGFSSRLSNFYLRIKAANHYGSHHYLLGVTYLHYWVKCSPLIRNSNMYIGNLRMKVNHNCSRCFRTRILPIAEFSLYSIEQSILFPKGGWVSWLSVLLQLQPCCIFVFSKYMAIIGGGRAYSKAIVFTVCEHVYEYTPPPPPNYRVCLQEYGEMTICQLQILTFIILIICCA